MISRPPARTGMRRYLEGPAALSIIPGDVNVVSRAQLNLVAFHVSTCISLSPYRHIPHMPPSLSVQKGETTCTTLRH